MAKNHMSGAGHVDSHPYPDKGVSGDDRFGPESAKTFAQAKPVSSGKQSNMTTRPGAMKK